MDRLADGERVQLRVDVEHHAGLGVGGRAADAADALVFLVVEGRDGEGFVKELRVG